MHGAAIHQNVRVASVLRRNGRAAGVRTECGHTIEAEYVVNAGGMWARQMAAEAGVLAPNQAAEVK